MNRARHPAGQQSDTHEGDVVVVADVILLVRLIAPPPLPPPLPPPVPVLIFFLSSSIIGFCALLSADASVRADYRNLQSPQKGNLGVPACSQALNQNKIYR